MVDGGLWAEQKPLGSELSCAHGGGAGFARSLRVRCGRLRLLLRPLSLSCAVRALTSRRVVGGGCGNRHAHNADQRRRTPDDPTHPDPSC